MDSEEASVDDEDGVVSELEEETDDEVSEEEVSEELAVSEEDDELVEGAVVVGALVGPSTGMSPSTPVWPFPS